MGKIYIPIGFPGCGKTTYFLKNLNDLDTLRINHDTLVDMITPNNYSPKLRDIYHTIEDHLLLLCLLTSKNVYIDRTNLTKKIRKRFMNKLEEVEQYVAVYFTADKDNCLDRNRNSNRDKTEDQKIKIEEWIKNPATFLEKPTFSEGFDEIITIDINGCEIKREKSGAKAQKD